MCIHVHIIDINVIKELYCATQVFSSLAKTKLTEFYCQTVDYNFIFVVRVDFVLLETCGYFAFMHMKAQ